MANVLCTGIHPGLVHTRKLILERGGHFVAIALSEAEVAAACQQTAFDVAVISQITAGKAKAEWQAAIRRHCPSARILEIYLPGVGTALDDADDWLSSSVELSQLASRVSALAGTNKKAATL